MGCYNDLSMAQPIEAILYGHVCQDKNESEAATYMGSGSPLMFMRKIFLQLPDVKATLVASYGEDFLPYTKDVQIYPPVPNVPRTLIYENVSIHGIRQQKALNRGEAVAVEINESVREKLQSSALTFVAPLLPTIPVSYVRFIRNAMPPSGLLTLLPQGYYRAFDSENRVIPREFVEADELIRIVDLIIASEEDSPDFRKQAKQWAASSNCLIVVTLGDKGAAAYKGNEEIMLSTRAVAQEDVVDTVGSGDIFSAVFALHYQKTRNIREAGRFANEIARQCLFYTPDQIQIDYDGLYPGVYNSSHEK
ncbi:MAG: hypothetical protein UY16_C0041G0005 [Candidatus Gottesmanbacteria bacterium GW2011_GWA2_47_9]|uniref:Carbohydrate kinase PfkB domain-containing protein n=1 Tax=Candidatus Gottesmanbacteria bacterium GW2011_GWA2_47_9 TaxID=1618445 RepID=A0A0G1W9M0_9BACT|nr:MAG: hypothetical protein UY16_C0041G0005 [Candidatus Gottesmanbacteria bacterium GW2011_GWA2_47_9]